jgi:hypothetical protein
VVPPLPSSQGFSFIAGCGGHAVLDEPDHGVGDLIGGAVADAEDLDGVAVDGEQIGGAAGRGVAGDRAVPDVPDLIAGNIPPPIRRQVKARAATLTEMLRSAWAPRPPSRRTPGVQPPLFPAVSCE